jgi:hypothetical protein
MTEEQVCKKYANKEFLNTDGLLVGDVICTCWNEKFEAATDVEIALRKKLVDLKEELVNSIDASMLMPIKPALVN